MHDDDAVAHAKDFFHIGTDHENGDALLGECLRCAIDLGLRADVDSARGFVEDEHLRVHRQPFAQNDFLLIAAGEIHDLAMDAGRLDAHPFDFLSATALSVRRLSQPAGCSCGSRAANILRDGHRQDQPMPLAVFGSEIDAASIASRVLRGCRARPSSIIVRPARDRRRR